MGREQSDCEDRAGETGTNQIVDATAEVELRLPLEVDMEPNQIREDDFPGPVNLDAFDPNPEMQHRFGTPNGAKPK